MWSSSSILEDRSKTKVADRERQFGHCTSASASSIDPLDVRLTEVDHRLWVLKRGQNDVNFDEHPFFHLEKWLFPFPSITREGQHRWVFPRWRRSHSIILQFFFDSFVGVYGFCPAYTEPAPAVPVDRSVTSSAGVILWHNREWTCSLRGMFWVISVEGQSWVCTSDKRVHRILGCGSYLVCSREDRVYFYEVSL